MTDLTPQQIATWLRNRAMKYEEMAKLIEQDIGFGPPVADNQPMGMRLVKPRDLPVTPKELEDSVRVKSGRVDDLALRLGATPAQILNAMEPNGRVYTGERGWLKVRE